MSNPTARIAPHRRDQPGSTAPPTAAARLAGLTPELRGLGDPLGAAAELKIVAERAAAFARELQAVGTVGSILAHRAALLSVRMEDLGRADVIAVQAAERRALADFDADRAAAIAELLAEAETPGADPTGALAALAGSPDGLAGLLRAWRGLLGRLGSNEPTAVEIAARWLRSARDAADLGARAEAEVDRLRALVGTMGGAERALAAARAEAGRLARFDPSPAATLARRHEAAAERGMYQAIRMIHQINRQAGRVEAQPASAAAPPLAAGTPPRPTPPGFAGPRDPLASFRAPADDPLASFRVGLDPASPEARRRRPDPGKLAAARR